MALLAAVGWNLAPPNGATAPMSLRLISAMRQVSMLPLQKPTTSLPPRCLWALRAASCPRCATLISE